MHERKPASDPPEAKAEPPGDQQRDELLRTLLKAALACAALYVFLTSVGMMGSGFKCFGRGFAEALISGTSNPFVGLFVGILSTAIVQSSSMTTSMVVAFVSSGTLTIENAVPVVMGANIGTTVTAALVSMGHITRRREFKRAYQASTVHDFFNLCSVTVLLPIELATGILQKCASHLSGALSGCFGFEFSSPLKAITSPPAKAIERAVTEGMGLSAKVAGTVLIVLGVALLIASLASLAKLMRSLMLKKLERFFEKSLGRSAALGILIGLVFTSVIQSSSVTTSLMVPLAAAGVMTVSQVFPVTVGANMGTTVTALLASLACNSTGLTIALVHMLFNMCGTLIWFVPPPMRRVPLFLSGALSGLAAKKRYWAVVFILIVFFALPGCMILITSLW